MSNDKKQKEEDKHKKLKQYAKENAEIAGIAAAGVAALPYLFRKKGTIEYYKDELERAKKNKH